MWKRLSRRIVGATLLFGEVPILELRRAILAKLPDMRYVGNAAYWAKRSRPGRIGTCCRAMKARVEKMRYCYIFLVPPLGRA
jgi:hypothetical protein